MRACCFSSPACSQAQGIDLSSPLPVSGSVDQGFTFKQNGSVGIDVNALSVIAQHLDAVHSPAWTNMKADAVVTFGNSQQEQSQATLICRDTDYVRLQMFSSNGIQSITAKQGLLKTAYTSGEPSILTGETGSAGLVQFHWIRANNLVNRLVSLRDDEIVAVLDHRYRRLAAVFTSQDSKTSTSASAQYSRMDFYFDLTTMVLDKTVAPVRVPGMANDLLLITSYSDYREVDKVLVPFAISQSLDGQVQWQLTLSNISFPLQLDSSLLTF